MTNKIKSKRKHHKNINYIIAIPSYKRYNEINHKTLPTLKRGKVNRDKISVFGNKIRVTTYANNHLDAANRLNTKPFLEHLIKERIVMII